MKSFKVKIYSVGGQGIKSMISRLEKSLEHRKDLFFTSLVKYDGIIKGGAVETNLIISNKQHALPFFDECNICVLLTNTKKTIPCDEQIVLKTFTKYDSLDLQKKIEEKILDFFEN